ncbi:MAG: sodium:solute symporter family protein [Gemmatimonadaceae bacterium]
MNAHLPILLAYSAFLAGLGIWIGRRVRSSDSFFVAGRALGPGLLFSTLIAANIGAGSTVGAAGLGYRDGLSAWWWVGSAAVGSMIQAVWIGPRMRDVAEARGLRTVGDYLEYRYAPSVRTTVALLLWVGTLAILAGQLIAVSTLLTAVAGVPKWVGCLLGGTVITIYFTAGGLLSSAWVSVVQVTVKFLGFALAFPAALAMAGGWARVSTQTPSPDYWNAVAGGGSGWTYLLLLAPAFVVSPGLLQKVFGARDERAVRIGVGLNAFALLAFASVPPLLGMIARALHPALSDSQLALPTLLANDVPVAIGALGLAALFSAEVSSADALLFMLATSLSQDLYKRVLNPQANDRQVLRVARLAAVAGGLGGIAIALSAQTIVGTLSFFYSVLGVCLFLPIVGGLYVSALRTRHVMVAIAAGIITMVGMQVAAGTPRIGWKTSAAGLGASLLAAMLLLLFSTHSDADTSRSRSA